MVLVPALGFISNTLNYLAEGYLLILLICHGVVAYGLVRFLFKGMPFEVAVRGMFLGLVFGLGLLVIFSRVSWVAFGWYMSALAFFHWSEYMITAICNPRTLTLSSYLLDHSREYHIAALASWLEFWIEFFLFPDMKQYRIIILAGMLLVMGGETLRKLAMWTAKTNFNHYVQHVKEEGHTLVTDGIYSLSRHPSYVGWFYWSVGTQLLLCNPVCLIAYTYVSWRFFKNRVEDEEITLLNFFGEDYVEYQRKVGTGLPFIKGYRMEL